MTIRAYAHHRATFPNTGSPHAPAALVSNDGHSECPKLCDERIEPWTKCTERDAVDVWIRAAHLREPKSSAAPGDLNVPDRADGDHDGDLVPDDPTRERNQRSEWTPYSEHQSLA